MKEMELLFTDYSRDVGQYLTSKLPDVPEHVAMEISEYIANKTNNLVASMLYERDREWRRCLNQQKRLNIYEKRDEK